MQIHQWMYTVTSGSEFVLCADSKHSEAHTRMEGGLAAVVSKQGEH